MKTIELFERALALTEKNRVSLLFRLWGYLESDTPKFVKGVETFIPQLEEEEKRSTVQ